MINRHLIARFILVVTLLGTFSFGAIAELVVIVHPSNGAQLDSKTIQRIFLGKEKKFSTGNEAIPINLEASAANREAFDSDVLGRSSNQVSAYWSKLVFTGKGIPPKEVVDEAAMIELVSKNPNAIGYVDRAAVSDAVKAIAIN